MPYAINGSTHLGSYIKKSDPNVLTILGALDAMNDPQRQSKIRGMSDLLPFVETIEGFDC